MAVEARLLGPPSLVELFLVREVIVNDQVEVHAWELSAKKGQECQLLLVAVADLALPNDFTVQHLQCGREGGRPMSDIVMGVGAAKPLPEGQSGLGQV